MVHARFSTPLASAVLAALLALAVVGCHKKVSDAPDVPEPSVHGNKVSFPANAPQLASLLAEVAKPRTLAITHLTGRLYWNDDVTVRIFTPVIGQVTSIKAHLGDHLQAGQTLAVIDSPDYSQALADAKTAAANLVAADKAYLRSKDLLEHGAAAGKDTETAEAAAAAAQAERERAFNRLKLYGGSVDDAQDRFRLKTPIAGELVEKNVDSGQEVRNDQMLANDPTLVLPLFVVSDPTSLWLQLDASETDIESLKPGLPLRITARAYPNRVFDGTIENLAESLDPTTRTLRVRGVVQNPDRLLKAEMYVLVDVVQDEAKVASSGLEISSKAVFTVDNDNFLYVETAPGTYERRKVTVGTERDGKIPVFTGVSAGEKVVTEGALLLEAIVNPSN